MNDYAVEIYMPLVLPWERLLASCEQTFAVESQKNKKNQQMMMMMIVMMMMRTWRRRRKKKKKKGPSRVQDSQRSLGHEEIRIQRKSEMSI